MISDDTEPVALFDVVYSPVKLGAECTGSQKRAMNSP